MQKSLLTAAVVLALSVSMAHADSRAHRAARQQNTTAATEQSVPTTSQQQGQRSQVSMSNQNNLNQTGRVGGMVMGNNNTVNTGSSLAQMSSTNVQAMEAAPATTMKRQRERMGTTASTATTQETGAGHGQLMLPQGQRSQVSMSNQNSLNQTGHVGSMVIGNNNNVNTGSSVAQMSSTNVQAMQAAPATTMKGHRNRMGTTATTDTAATQGTGTGQQVQNPRQGQAVQKSDISNTVQQTGAISSTVTGGNLNNANAASLSMSSVTRNPTTTASEQVTGSSTRQGRGQNTPSGETALGRQGGQKNGMMSTAIRNEVQQTGAISSTISGGDNNSANAASLAMKGTTLGGGVRNSIVGSGDISAKISGGSDNRANAGSVALGQTSIGGNVVNDVRNTGAISSTIEEGSNNMANAASISIN